MSDTNIKNSKTSTILYAIVLTGLGGVTAIIGFGCGMRQAKEDGGKYFEDGLTGAKDLRELPMSLAKRALFWGTVWACSGCGLVAYGLWKLNKTQAFQEFRTTVRSKIQKHKIPEQQKQVVTNLNDLMKYLTDD